MAARKSFCNFHFAVLIVATIANVSRCFASECLEDKPQLEPTDKLEIKIFYSGDSIGNILDDLCVAIQKVKAPISIKILMGAATKKGIRDLICGDGDNCFADRNIACQTLQIPNFHSCDDMPSIDFDKLINCIRNKSSDYILIENTEKRRNLGITDDQLPAVVYGESYDSCEKHTCVADILANICELYDYRIDGCEI